MVKFGRNRSTTASSDENTGTASQSQGTGRNLENVITPTVVTNQSQVGNDIPNISDLLPSYSYEGQRVPGPSPYGPPPPYSTPEGEYRVLITNFRGGESYMDFQHAGPILCPNCRQFTVARVGYSYSTLAYLAACLLCLSGCFCLCFWVPFCMESCMQARYYCSLCGHYLGYSHIASPVF